jgi:hypothetical protein
MYCRYNDKYIERELRMISNENDVFYKIWKTYVQVFLLVMNMHFRRSLMMLMYKIHPNYVSALFDQNGFL